MPNLIDPSSSAAIAWSRRALLQSGALAALGTLLPWRLRAADQAAASLPVISKPIPSTGERIAAIGVGTNQFGRAPFDDIRAVLERMHALGGTMIDTAAMYGDSEAVIGRALAGSKLRQGMFVATKFNAEGVSFGPPPGAGGPAGFGGPGGSGGPPPGMPPPPPRDNVYGQASFERSLKRLQTDRVDLLYAHFLASADPLMPLMRELKKAGKARYIGITAALSAQHAELAEKMRQHPIDFIQVDYSIGNRDAETTVFPLAIERKIAVAVAVPFAAAGGGRGGALLQEVADRPLPDWAADIDVKSWSQFFLKYAISHPAVTCAIPGSTKLEHLIDNQLAGHGRLPDAAMRKRMEEYWDAKPPVAS